MVARQALTALSLIASDARPDGTEYNAKLGVLGSLTAQSNETGTAVLKDIYFGGGTWLALGCVTFFTDTIVFQPFRIEHDDNANLLVNTVGWLARRPVDSALRAKFRANLFLTEADLVTIAKDEQ